jgi:two-component system, cell cycle sensor histidine kinase and response regulator CckA
MDAEVFTSFTAPAAMRLIGQVMPEQNGVATMHTIVAACLAVGCFWAGLSMTRLLRRRLDLPFRTTLRIFALALLATGVWQAFEIAAAPSAEFAVFLKAVVALFSFALAVALHRAVPEALKLPNAVLLRQVAEDLETRVRERTADLSATNERLAREAQQRQQAEAEIRRLNQSLQERVNELQTLLDLLPVGIGIAQDPECRDIRANKLFAEMLGISALQNASLSAPPIQPMPFRVKQNGRELSADELPMQRAARENAPVLDFEETIVRSDGRELHVMVNAVPLRDAEGKARGAVATVQDITAHKAAAEDSLAFERRLQETQKLESLGVLAGGIAHDFNNLLTGILGNASIARLELPPGHAPVRAALDNVEQAAMRAADLCKQMLAYAGKGRFVVQPLSLSGIVRETAELLEVSINKRATLELELGEELPAFQGDASQVRQVLMNLVINAAEAIGARRGRITVRTSCVQVSADMLAQFTYRDSAREGVFVCLEVTDTGCGMDKQMLARIFDPFFTTKFTGRGLGLAAVLGIVRGHKGAIAVESGPDRGSSFKILFPSLQQRATPPEPLLQAAPAEQQTGSILVVDDEPAVRGVAVRVLRNAGYRVAEAADGAAAVELVRRSPSEYSLVLLDLTMPRMDGEEAFRLLREINPDIRVVVMSGFNEQDTENRFIGQRLSGFVAKPFGAETLLSKVKTVLQRR